VHERVELASDRLHFSLHFQIICLSHHFGTHQHIIATHHSFTSHTLTHHHTMPSKTKSSKAPPSSEPLDDLAAEPPTEEIDPYAVLSVARDATDDQIKKAYRKAALKHHPGKLVPFATSCAQLQCQPLIHSDLHQPITHSLPRQGNRSPRRHSPHRLPTHRLRLLHPLHALPSLPLRSHRLHHHLPSRLRRWQRSIRLVHLLPQPIRRNFPYRSRRLQLEIQEFRRGARGPTAGI